MTRQQNLAHAVQLCESHDWKWMREKLEEAVRVRKLTINSRMDKDTLFRAGVVAGMEWCMTFPERARDENQKLADKIMERIMGGTI